MNDIDMVAPQPFRFSNYSHNFTSASVQMGQALATNELCDYVCRDPHYIVYGLSR